MLCRVCKPDTEIVFKHVHVLCGKHGIGDISGNDVREESVAPQKAPIVYELEAYGFQTRILSGVELSVLEAIVGHVDREIKKIYTRIFTLMIWSIPSSQPASQISQLVANL